MNNVKIYSVGSPRTIEPYKVSGTTMTVPNLAPTLIEIINSSINGDKVPLVGNILYDKSESVGSARVMANNATMDAKYNFASEEQEQTESRSSEQESEITSERESDTAEEG